jgi:hypothetical protein
MKVFILNILVKCGKFDAMKEKNLSGEVASVSGISFQYTIFATEIYNSLIDNKNQIEWIEFASSEAGKIDDVLIGLKNKVLAFQVKKISSSKFSFSNLVISNTESILEGMFIGWKKLVVDNPGKTIDVRLVTTQPATENDKIESYKGDKKPSFKQFISEFWLPIFDTKYNSNTIPLSWENTFQELLKLTKSSPSQFVEFIKSTRFMFEYSLPKLFDTYTEQQRRIDIEEIAKNIFNTIGKIGNVRYTKNEFLERFHLKNRYESYFRHSFFVDEEHFQPINETITQIQELITSTSKGYIALIGNAGSGKSTLLTKWIQQSNYNILKYYAYVNTEMNYEFGFRGEAKVFLHDILVQIRQSKFSPQNRLPTENFEDLQKHFNEELNKISYNNEKTIIIVDGLDHIEREQQVERSLIGILPLPEHIPDNIYFLLGSRTIENLDKLSPRICSEIKSEKRVIHINPMTKDRVHNLLNSYKISLSDDVLEKLYKNTLGHPLFLRYTIEEVKNLSQEDIYAVISKRVFSGDIYKEYQVFWEKNKRQDDFVEILGFISRFRHSSFDISIFNSFPNITRDSLFKINKLSENYFYKIGGVWQFFHNSFKDFLVTETARNILTAEHDDKIDKAFHLKICDVLNGIDTEYKWNKLYHLYKAESFEAIVHIANQSFFRKQWFEFRNYRLIKEDIQIAIEAARKRKEIYCLLGLMLTNFEFKQRYNNFTPSNYFDTFYQLGLTNLANSFIYDNVELLVPEHSALNYCFHMYREGFKELSHAIFLRATPSYILNHSKTVSPHRYHRNSYNQVDEVELICAWAKAACLFLPIEKIFEQVDSISVEEGHGSTRRGDFYSEVFSEVLEVSILIQNENHLRTLELILLKKSDKDRLFYFYFNIITKLDENVAFHSYSITKLSSWENSDNNPINRRLLLVYLFKDKNVQGAKPVFDKLLPPIRIPRQDASIDDNSLLNYIFDYSAFYYILNKQFSQSPSFFLPNDEKYTKTAFYNAFAELGKSYAYLYHNYKDAAVGYYLNFENFLKLFRYGHTDYGYEYSIAENKSVLINLILKISSKLSADIFNEILTRLEHEWTTQKFFWRTGQIQNIISWVIDSEINRDWCIKQLDKIDERIFKTGYVDDRIDKTIKQIDLWCKLGEKAKGNRLMEKVMEISLSVRGEKDNQLDYLVDFLNHISSDISSETEYYLSRVNSILEKVNSRTHTPSIEVLALTLKYGNGFKVFKYLLFEGLVSFNDAVEIVLTYFLAKLPKQKSLTTKLFTRIVLAFDNNHSYRWRFFEKLLEQSNELKRSELEEIVNEISVYSIQEHRNDYLLKIQEYCKTNNINPITIGLSDHILAKENKNKRDTDVLEFENGNRMTSEEISIKVANLQDLSELQASARSYNSFDWSETYSRVFKITTDEEIFKFINNAKFETKELSNISKALIEINRTEIAKNILYRAIKSGDKNGWVTFYDGGSKIIPFELLSKIEEREIFQESSLNDYSNSILSFGVEATEIQIKDILKIWQYFTDDINIDKIYSELKEYRTELLKDEAKDPSAPSVLGDSDDTNFLVEVLFFLITFPSDFDNNIYKILIEESNADSVILKMLLEKLYENKFNSKYIKLLAILNTNCNYFLNKQTYNVINLLNNDRYDISRIAFRILESFKIDPELYIHKQTKKLPFIYTIKLDYKPSLFDTKEAEIKNINKKGFLKDTQDTLAYVRLYLTEIKILSEETNIEIINIAQRVMQLGKDSEFPLWCNSISEEEIRRIYNGRFNLEISYKRPRNQLVWDGLMKVIKEFVDLELIDEELADELSDDFDEGVFMINPSPKPDFIGSILEGTSLRAPSARKEWVTELNQTYLERTMAFKGQKNTYILAEHSTMKGMGWGYNEELRQSFVGFNPNIDFGDDRTLIFNFTSKSRVDDYLNLQNKGITLYNGLLTINKKRNWLAINPMMCLSLGLKFNQSEGCFRWEDKQGNKVFESIYWQLHSFENYSRNHDSETGYGWYIIMYEQGYKLLRSIVGDKDFYHHKKISRHMEYSQERYNTDLNESHSVSKSEKLIL